MQKLNKNELISFLALQDLTPEDARLVVKILKNDGLVKSVVYSGTPSCRNFCAYLEEFWTWEKSPYIKEKLFLNQSIHRRYTERNVNIVKNYWKPFFRKRSLGSITRNDVKMFQLNLAEKSLSSESVNQITRVGVTALKWAWFNSLTENNCFEGIRYCAVKHKERDILAMDEACLLFAREWNSYSSMLANLTAMCTGLRAAEIQALRKSDLGKDRLYIRHSWSEFDRCLKTPKNGHERIVPCPDFLLELLKKYMQENCGKNLSENSFVFKSVYNDFPENSRKWRRNLTVQIKKAGIKNTGNIVFHSWRHFYSTVMADFVDIRILKFFTGHKSMEMIKHYSDHILESDFAKVRKAEDFLFSEKFKNLAE